MLQSKRYEASQMFSADCQIQRFYDVLYSMSSLHIHFQKHLVIAENSSNFRR